MYAGAVTRSCMPVASDQAAQQLLEASPEGIIPLFDEMRHQLLELWQ